MSNTEPKLEVHWLVNMAQELRDSTHLSLTPKSSRLDPDLAHPALSVLGELIDRCGSDIQPQFLSGFAFGLQQVGLIDDVVLKAIETHVGASDDNQLTSSVGRNLN